jgi:hypothetical protein
MPDTTTDNGQLVKMEIIAYKDDKCSDEVSRFKVMFNPAAYAQKYEVNYADNQAQGNTASAQAYSRTKPLDYTFEFVIDGTGTAADKVDVKSEINKFLDNCVHANGEIHRPHYLKLLWGSLEARVVLKVADVTYNFFDNNGYPLRAKISAQFTENIPDDRRVRQDRQSSPDRTHYREVDGSGKLPIMAFKEYRDQRFYLSIARANKLNNFRRLSVNTTVIMPPISNTTNG